MLERDGAILPEVETEALADCVGVDDTLGVFTCVLVDVSDGEPD